MATGTYAPWFLEQLFDDNGKVLNGGTIETFIAGTSTHAPVYTDVGLSNAYANPLTLNSAGRLPSNGSMFLTPGASYKFLVKKSDGSVIATPDSISAVPGTSGGVDVTGTAGETLTAGKIAYLSDGSGGKTAGLWYLADSTNAYSSTTPLIGMVPATITSGASGAIRLSGTVEGLSSLTVGTLYYVGTAGAVTSTAPANARLLGQADTTSSLVLSANPPPASVFSGEIRRFYEGITTVTIAAGVVALDLSLTNNFKVSLTANVTSITVSNWTPSKATPLVLRLTQDATGSRTVAFPAGWRWPSGSVPVQTSTANKADIVLLWSDDGGTTIFASMFGQNF